ncbi:hypothetical protein Zmor_009321 [Zophobas morio]|uniref:Uncharacterized protein n=1 Tax=Zophobas morio TaxID=2755281 RepID=A0AA38IIU6_9CUCU|nr:hypothetical protein Zmor_009321 [Zophobas morio]
MNCLVNGQTERGRRETWANSRGIDQYHRFTVNLDLFSDGQQISIVTSYQSRPGTHPALCIHSFANFRKLNPDVNRNSLLALDLTHGIKSEVLATEVSRGGSGEGWDGETWGKQFLVGRAQSENGGKKTHRD